MPPLSKSDATEKAESLINSNFKGYAALKLRALDPEVLSVLAELCSRPGGPTPTEPDDIVAMLLEAKKSNRLVSLREQLSWPSTGGGPPPAEARPVATACRSRGGPATADDERRLAKDTEESDEHTIADRDSTFCITGHTLRILAFNSLKLRLEKEELEDDWDQALLIFKDYDVLLLSEVRAGQEHMRKRAGVLQSRLEEQSGVKWSMEVSEPSAPSASKSPEVHLLLARDPVRVESHATIHEIDELSYDYAPLVAAVTDPRLEGAVKTVCLTSLHMPPDTAKRRDARDLQVQRLLESYPLQPKWRLNRPFTDKCAKNAKMSPVVHVLAGDFNCCPADDRYEAARNGWHVAFGHIPTSSGRRPFDNFVYSANTHDHFVIKPDVRTLARPQRSGKKEIGISDHSPIVLELKEVPQQPLPKARTKKAAVP